MPLDIVYRVLPRGFFGFCRYNRGDDRKYYILAHWLKEVENERFAELVIKRLDDKAQQFIARGGNWIGRPSLEVRTARFFPEDQDFWEQVLTTKQAEPIVAKQLPAPTLYALPNLSQQELHFLEFNETDGPICRVCRRVVEAYEGPNGLLYHIK